MEGMTTVKKKAKLRMLVNFNLYTEQAKVIKSLKLCPYFYEESKLINIPTDKETDELLSFEFLNMVQNLLNNCDCP